MSHEGEQVPFKGALEVDGFRARAASDGPFGGECLRRLALARARPCLSGLHGGWLRVG